MFYYLRLISCYLKLTFKNLIAFRGSFIGTFLNVIINVLIWLLFWAYLLPLSSVSKEVNFFDILLITGFAQIFIGSFGLFFVGCLLISDLIVEGKIDRYLTLPTPIFISILGEHFRVWGVSYLIIGLALTCFSIFFYPISLPFYSLVIGIIVAFFGLVLINEVYSFIGILGFYFGKTLLATEILSSFDSIAEVPIINPLLVLKILFVIILPYFFISSGPVLIITGKLDLIESIAYLVFSILMSIIWLFILRITWNKGLKRYNSVGG